MRFHPPPPDLRRYFTTFYYSRIAVPDGGTVEDALQPEWANLRMFRGPGVEAAWIGEHAPVTDASFVVTGPSARCAHFRIASSSFWGIGMLPLGWAQFVRAPAADHANLVADGMVHSAFAGFRPLAAALAAETAGEEADLAAIVAFFRARLADPPADSARIVAIHEALVDPEVGTVADLVARTGSSQRTIERLAQRAFGFSPKLLLRRQRFMRSLAQFMLDPSLKWIGAIDSHYHDQAQFVREFHQFMGMAPRDYAALPHPVLDVFMRERARIAGSAVQTLDAPGGVGAPS
ncbi:MAG: helix-turn-helix domain-containing protein [Novosphingobium sp.]